MPKKKPPAIKPSQLKNLTPYQGKGDDELREIAAAINRQREIEADDFDENLVLSESGLLMLRDMAEGLKRSINRVLKSTDGVPNRETNEAIHRWLRLIEAISKIEKQLDEKRRDSENPFQLIERLIAERGIFIHPQVIVEEVEDENDSTGPVAQSEQSDNVSGNAVEPK